MARTGVPFEYRLFTELAGVRGKIGEQTAAEALRGLAGGAAGEAAYREAYPTRTPRRCSSWSTPTGCSACRPCTWPRRTPRRAHLPVPAYAPGRRLTRIVDDPPDVVAYPEQASLHIWDQHRFGVLDLIGAPA